MRRCPNCKKGFMEVRNKRYMKCKRCGYIKYKSPRGRRRGVIFFPKEDKQEKKEEIPKIRSKEEERERKPKLPRGEGFHTTEYKERKFFYDQSIKLQNKTRSIEKILKELRKNKYSPIKQIIIEGELWDVETGKLAREKEKPKREEKEKFAPDRIVENMVSKGS